MSYKEKVKPFRKIYLKRNPNASRGIINHKEIDEFLLAEDFEVHQLDKISFVEETKIFNEAKIIIGPIGSAFSNMTYMQKGTYAIAFFPNNIFSLAPYVGQSSADISEVNLIHILSENKTTTLHEKMKVNLEYVKQVLKSIK